MKVVIVVHGNQRHTRARYALSTLLEVTGLPYEFVTATNWREPGKLPLHYGLPENGLDAGCVVIPQQRASYGEAEEPVYKGLDDTPISSGAPRLSQLLVEKDDVIQIQFDLVQSAFWLLSRREELEPSPRDRFDRFPFEEHWLTRRSLTEEPLVNQYAALLRRAIELASRHARVPLIRKACWPHRQSHAVVLSHDVDDAGRFSLHQARRLLRKGISERSPRGVARGLYFAARRLSQGLTGDSDPYWNFEKLMTLEDAYGFRSTFFFVADAASVDRDPPYAIAAQHVQQLLGRLADAGWETGLHGSFESYRDRDRLQKEREKLGSIVGTPVLGIRQHYLRLAVPHTFRAQSQAGFVYDSTLGYRGGIGFRSGAAFPFHPFDFSVEEPLPLLELPLSAMDGALFWQLKLSPDEATSRTVRLLETVRRHRGLAVLLWHQRAWHEEKYPGWGSTYESILSHLGETAGAWVAPGSDVAEWWLAREEVQLQSATLTDGEGCWAYRCGRPIEGLVMELVNVPGEQVQIRGANGIVRTTGRTRREIEFPSLHEEQQFDIVVSGAV